GFARLAARGGGSSLPFRSYSSARRRKSLKSASVFSLKGSRQSNARSSSTATLSDAPAALANGTMLPRKRCRSATFMFGSPCLDLLNQLQKGGLKSRMQCREFAMIGGAAEFAFVLDYCTKAMDGREPRFFALRGQCLPDLALL